ncbi:MAG: hypothetical protein PHD86_06540 [Kiritimatiellae bacterium]|nr:hypothetical protein [Kiritimatiellia bacterium]
MSLRINLMKTGEMRHSGAVRRSFLIQIAVAAVVCILALGALFVVIEARSTDRELQKLKAALREVEKTYNEIKEVQQNLTYNTQVLDELDTWTRSRILWHEGLMDVQALVPQEVRFTAFEVSSTLSLLDQKAPASPDATAPKTPPPPVPIRTYRLYLSGKVTHELANRVVVGFVEHLRREDRLGPLFQSVKLQRMDKNTEQGALANEHLFAVEALSYPRQMTKEKAP